MALETAGNIAALFGGALKGYQDQSEIELKRKNIEADNAYKKAMLDMEYKKNGLIRTDGGTPEFSPEMEEKKRLEKEEKLLDLDTKKTNIAKTLSEISDKGYKTEIRPGLLTPISGFVSKEEKKEARQLENEAKKEAKEQEKISRQQTTELRKEFLGLPTTKDIQAMDTSLKKLTAAAKDATGADDIAIVFNFMKLQDPGSTVREGEYANAQQAAGVSDKVIAQYNKLLAGETLTPEQRKMFVESAGKTYNAALDAYSQMGERYKGLAKKGNLSPEDVVPEYKRYTPNEVTIDPKIEAAKKALKSNDPTQRKGAENFLRSKGVL